MRSRAAYTTARLKDIDRIARRLKPDYLIPAVDPTGEGSRILGNQTPDYWIDYFTRAARLAHYIYPRIKVSVPMSSYGTRDSALYAWAARPGSPIDAVGFSLLAGFDGARSLDTACRVMAHLSGCLHGVASDREAKPIVSQSEADQPPRGSGAATPSWSIRVPSWSGAEGGDLLEGH